MKTELYISCPICGWEPDDRCRWVCEVCDTRWDTFATEATCPTCGKVYEETACHRGRGGCGEMSPHADWYQEIEVSENKPQEVEFTWPWERKEQLPVTENDRKWTEENLILLSERFGPAYFKTLSTITPDKNYLDYKFTGAETDAKFVFEWLAAIMAIDTWEISLFFFSNRMRTFPDGTVIMPAGNGQSKFVDNGYGQKEIWIELELLNDTVALIAALACELMHYKLTNENGRVGQYHVRTELAVVAFGFGIFKGNSFFKITRWTRGRQTGWQMQKSGYLPEQMIAYAMAWLAHYREEDLQWKHYLNKTMKKYFDRSYQYIDNNKALIAWPNDAE